MAPDDRVAALVAREARVRSLQERHGHVLLVAGVQLIDADDVDVVQHVHHVLHHALVGIWSR